MSRRYAPGTWFGAVSAQGVALLPADLDLDLVEGVWERLGRGKGLGGVLEALTGAFGTSLSAIPPFAVVLGTAEQARLAVRGPLTVSVRVRAGDPVVVSGLGVTTWSERVIDEPLEIELLVDGAPPVERWFPLADGVALVSGIRLPLAIAPVTGEVPRVTPAPAAAAVPAFSTPTLTTSPPPVPPVSSPVASPPVGPAVTPVSAPPTPVADAPASVPEPIVSDPGTESDVIGSEVAEVDSPAPDETQHESPHDGADGETWMPPVETAGPEIISSLPPASAPVPPPAEVDEYDHLWGATVVKPVSDAAVRPDPEPDSDTTSSPVEVPKLPLPPTASGDLPGDHDGETISFEQAQALRGDSAPTPAAAPLERPPVAHGRIVLSTGREVELDRSVVIGRRPRAVRVTGGILPHLIAVDSPQQDISRSHVEIRTEGDTVLVVDLDTTNGTVLIREGAPPVRLHPGEPTIVIDGDIVDLGDDITVTFRGIG